MPSVDEERILSHAEDLIASTQVIEWLLNVVHLTNNWNQPAVAILQQARAAVRPGGEVAGTLNRAIAHTPRGATVGQRWNSLVLLRHSLEAQLRQIQ